MIILGLETSGLSASVCLYDSSKRNIIGEYTIKTEKMQSQVIMPMLENMMEMCGKSIDHVDKIAVSKGPGSYTGIRIGISAAKAMSFAKGIPLCGISSLEVLAIGSKENNKIVCPMIYARKNYNYAGFYFVNKNEARPVESDALLSDEEFQKICYKRKCDVFVQSDKIIYKNLNLISSKTFAGEVKKEYPLLNAGNLCRAAVYHEAEDAEKVNPLYLQKTEAERNLEGKS